MMKGPADDFTAWRIQQEHLVQPFPYVFPKMPRRFRWFRALGRGIFLIQWSSSAVFFGLLAGGIFLVGQESPAPPLFYLGLLASLFVTDLFFLLRFVLGWLWRCPACGTRFPYYRPAWHRDILVHKEFLQALKFLWIAYDKPKFCPLFFPSVCPECKKKFFRKDIEASA